MIKHLSSETLSSKALIRKCLSVFLRVMRLSTYTHINISRFGIYSECAAPASADHITILTYSNVIKRPPRAHVAERTASPAYANWFTFPGVRIECNAAIVMSARYAWWTITARRQKVWCTWCKNIGRSGTLRGQERCYIKNMNLGTGGLVLHSFLHRLPNNYTMLSPVSE
jgi:hypothetical protein